MLLVGLGVVAALPAVGQAERHAGDRREKGPNYEPKQLRAPRSGCLTKKIRTTMT